MWIVGPPPANMTYTIAVGDGLYGFIEQESAYTGEATTIGVWGDEIVFGPTTASPLKCTLLLATPVALLLAIGLCGVVLWRSHRSSRRRALPR